VTDPAGPGRPAPPPGAAPRLAVALALAALAAGLVLRFAHLERRPFSADEMWTAYRVAGVHSSEVKAETIGAGPRTAAALVEFFRPRADRSALEVVRLHASDEPHHGPLFFAATRLFAKAAGDGTAALRAFAALTSCLLIPAAYLLGRDLRARGADPLAGLLLAALAAVAPALVAYGQDARPHGPALALLAWSSWMLLVACREGTARDLGAYAALVAATLLDFPAAALGFAAHAAYVAALRRSGAGAPPTRGVLLAWAAAAAVTAPWWVNLLRLHGKARGMLGWTGWPLSLAGQLDGWVVFLARCVGDPRWAGAPPSKAVSVASAGGLAALVAALSVAGGASLLRRAGAPAAVLAAGLAASALLPLAAADLAVGGQRSSVGRHMVSSLLGVEVLLAAGIAALLGGAAPARRATGTAALALVLASALAADVAFVRSDLSWAQVKGDRVLAVIRAVGPEPGALVVWRPGVEQGRDVVLAAARSVPPETLFQSFDPGAPAIPPEVRRVATLGETDALAAALAAQGFAPEGGAPLSPLVRSHARRAAPVGGDGTAR
jgi:hypothetical protein